MITSSDQTSTALMPNSETNTIAFIMAQYIVKQLRTNLDVEYAPCSAWPELGMPTASYLIIVRGAGHLADARIFLDHNPVATVVVGEVWLGTDFLFCDPDFPDNLMNFVIEYVSTH